MRGSTDFPSPTDYLLCSELPTARTERRLDRRERRDASVRAPWFPTLGAIAVSLLVVPGGLSYLFAAYGPRAVIGSRVLLVGLVAMLPGVLMGATALWVSAHD